MRHEVEARALELSVQLDCDFLPVLGDRVQLQQVIVNLFLNAVQAQTFPKGAMGLIDIKTGKEQDGGVFFAIRDRGPGIVEADLDRIFGSFFTTKEEGIGIGLAVCQSIMAAHGGTITASNHPEGGALFRFSLPRTTGS
jgi:signal transduction histidine kinase